MDPILKAARDKLAALQAKRADLQKQILALLAAPAEAARGLDDAEAAQFETLSADVVDHDTQIDAVVKQIAGLEANQKRTEAAALAALQVAPPAVVTSESMTYDKYGQNSYMRDLATMAVAARRMGTTDAEAGAALDRLNEHNRQMDAAARSDKVVAERLREIRKTPAGLEQRVNPNTTDGTGGEFVPPLWLVNQYIPLMRPGRAFANRVTNLPLPPGTDSINIPKITTGTLTGIQATQGSGVTSQDVVTTSVSATVNTIAGQEDISLQLLEQSPISMDGVLFDDLSRDYDQRLDLQVILGTGANGQHLGVLKVVGATTNTDPTKASEISSTVTLFIDPTAANSSQYKNVINAVNQVETLRFAPPTGIWVHPRRANSWSAAGDSTGRPLFIPSKYGAFNVAGLDEDRPVPQGVAGELFGLPVIKDANMPTLCNGFAANIVVTTGATQDAVVVLKEDDLYLWEGALRMRALPEILSGTLQIRFQLYAYSAFMPNRLPASITQIVGSGYAAASIGF